MKIVFILKDNINCRALILSVVRHLIELVHELTLIVMGIEEETRRNFESRNCKCITVNGLENHYVFLGKVSVSQCPFLYHQSQIMFLPTLLECFSALERMCPRYGNWRFRPNIFSKKDKK